jgi:cellulose synthase/poly-beta-1,6-N-acetylglucosamine synthase-like glycosyltransferase
MTSEGVAAGGESLEDRSELDIDAWSERAHAELRAEMLALMSERRRRADSLRRRLKLRGRTAPLRRRGGERPVIVSPGITESEAFLTQAVDGLDDRLPELSSRRLVGRRVRLGSLAFVAVNLVLVAIWPIDVLIAWVGVITVVYAATIVDRVVLYVRSADERAIDVVSEEEARAVPDEDLPTFTILVPAYREPEVIQHLLRSLGEIDYPAEKLEVKLLLEADDHATIAAATDVELGLEVDVILVPAAEPRTKPKALNYGLQLATGDIISIYDAEDAPEALQLRRAAVVLARHGEQVACVQAQLSYSNVHQNVITRWFTLEYAVWFALFLPGLVASGAPVPLGGTSNHFRRSVLDRLGAWDPFNVTEDADLGIRMHRQGYRTRVVKSVTYEEANSDFVNWVKQRSRWYKGYLQTVIVHLRRPRQLWRELGPRGFARFFLFVGGTPALALLNPVFWTLTILWFADRPHLIRAIFPAPVFYLGLLCWAFGNFTIAYLWIVATRLTGRTDLLFAALLAPLYWVMMSVAAVKALVQLVVVPSYWEKTTHGLHLSRRRGAPVSEAVAAP